MKEIEIWKTIDEFPNYEVSNLGRVKVKKTGKIRKTVINKNNRYELVMLVKDGKYCNRYVHRLVAQTFLPNAQNLPEVDHIDRNRTNNVVTNLKWCDRHENMYGRGQYYIYKGRKIMQIDSETGAVVATWEDYIHAGKAFGIRPNRIAQVLDEKDTGHLTLFGYVFKFL